MHYAQTMPVCDVNMTNSYVILALYLFEELCNQLTVCGPIAGAVLMYYCVSALSNTLSDLRIAGAT